jgi:hypothetical protein
MIYKLQLFSTLLLAGLILTIQFVHYPLWRYVAKDKLKLFEKRHQRLITPIVASLMILEGITACLLLKGFNPIYVTNFIALCGIWLSTFFLQVPMHQKLLQGQDVERSIDRLIKTNFIRTILWIFRAVSLAFFV